jgi:hypothetical protein
MSVLKNYSAEQILDRRLRHGPVRWIDIESTLLHFALITYAVPLERLRPRVPSDRFELLQVDVAGRPVGLLSAVAYLCEDFRFARAAPFARFRFGQTSHRMYVVEKTTGEHVVWFLGTQLGSRVVHAVSRLWRLPWHHSRYAIDCEYRPSEMRYTQYSYRIQSAWCDADIELEDTGEQPRQFEGFDSLQECLLVLTHPVEGFYHRLDGSLGTYSVWHDKLPISLGRVRRAYFSLYERLGLLTRDEMASPHSVLLCPQVALGVHMPPRKLT